MNRIHMFELNEKKIVLDINSGSVHVVDELTWDIIKDYLNNSLNDIIYKYKSKYNEDSIKDAYKEIKFLIDKDILFSEDIYEKYVDINKQNIVKALCLHVAHDCNLKCKYCFASQGDYKGSKEIMSLDVGKKSLDFLVENSGNRRNLEVDFFGGEPLMNFEVVKELVKYGRELEKEYNKNFRFTITTNGVLLDDDKIDYINKEMQNVVLSLDGRKEVNDNMRLTDNDKGSYDLIVPKYKNLLKKRQDKDYFIRGTFTNKNLDFSKDVLHYKELGFDVTSMEPVVTDPKEDYAIREEHLDTILKEYEKLSKEYIKINKAGENFSFYHFIIDLNQGSCAIRRVAGCGAGSYYLAVTPNGQLYPCHQFVDNEELKLGDVEKGITNNELREEFKNISIYNKEDCPDCWARFYCSGGCHANAYNANGDFRKPDKLSCEMEKKRLECAISIAANLD
ncbi:MAG: thioether cross-link-forming SCIFF peptide maturase [Firmicutes bacterium]|nr:thioether cross-link-forming SCIFF peptide maturase [Bacillota bacterium]